MIVFDSFRFILNFTHHNLIFLRRSHERLFLLLHKAVNIMLEALLGFKSLLIKNTKSTLSGALCFWCGRRDTVAFGALIARRHACSHLLAKKYILCIFLYARSPLRLQVPSYLKHKKHPLGCLVFLVRAKGLEPP